MSDRGGASAPLVELTLARLREFVREPEALFWVIVFPILMAMALGIAFRASGDEPVVVGLTGGPGREAIEQALTGAPGVVVRPIEPGRIAVALQRAEVQLVVEAAEPPVYHLDVTRAESRLARRVVDDVLQRAAGRQDVFTAREAPIDAVGSRYIDWLLPGLLGMNIMGTGLWGLGFSIVQARTRKLLKRLVASPMRRRDYLLSQLFGRLVFLVVEVAALVGFGWLAFGVPVRGSLLTLAGTCLAGALSFGGIGLLVASRAKTVEAVSGLLNLVMLPMWLLSGVFFSASNFPDAMQPAIQALPLTGLNDALRAVMLEGAGIGAILPELALLAVWGIGSFAIALRIFRWR
ncbi:MAG TPA: ABC transporter permease [Vicinamibacterales bacterium]